MSQVGTYADVATVARACSRDVFHSAYCLIVFAFVVFAFLRLLSRYKQISMSTDDIKIVVRLRVRLHVVQC